MMAALLLVVCAGLALAWFGLSPLLQEDGVQALDLVRQDDATGEGAGAPAGTASGGVVLDISVHTLDELQVLLDRAEELAKRPRPAADKSRVVLVLHGPEVAFFTRENYARYKPVVDQAERLDAYEVVDVKICRSMMERQGIGNDDIPAFIEQVPYGPGEVERLVRRGYVYF